MLVDFFDPSDYVRITRLSWPNSIRNSLFDVFDDGKDYPNIVKRFRDVEEYIYTLRGGSTSILNDEDVIVDLKDGDVILHDPYGNTNSLMDGAIFIDNNWVEIHYHDGDHLSDILIEEKKRREERKRMFVKKILTHNENSWTSTFAPLSDEETIEMTKRNREFIFESLDEIDSEIFKLNKELDKISLVRKDTLGPLFSLRKEDLGVYHPVSVDYDDQGDKYIVGVMK